MRILLSLAPVLVLSACAEPVEPRDDSDLDLPPPTQAAQSDEDPAEEGPVIATIPARYLGVWDFEEGTCAPESDLRVEIEESEITFYESVGSVASVTTEEDDVIVDLAMSGEGESWDSKLRLSLVGEGENARLHTSDGAEPKAESDTPLKACPVEEETDGQVEAGAADTAA